jgi:hypothetical protein
LPGAHAPGTDFFLQLIGLTKWQCAPGYLNEIAPGMPISL